MTSCVVLVLRCIAGCSGSHVVVDWVVVRSWLPRGRSVVDLHANRGDEMWVVTDDPELTVGHLVPQEEQDLLPGADIGGAPTAIWASVADDLWVAGPGLWRWDGVAWTEVELAPLDGKSAELRDVWGRAPDDVWVTAQVDGESKSTALHFDGSSWSKERELRDLMWTFEALEEGCSTPAGDVWVRARSDREDDSAMFHWDGAAWQRSDAEEMVIDMTCSGETVWVIGDDPHHGAFLHFWTGGWWEPRVSLDATIQFEHLWAQGQGGWITGRDFGRVVWRSGASASGTSIRISTA